MTMIDHLHVYPRKRSFVALVQVPALLLMLFGSFLLPAATQARAAAPVQTYDKGSPFGINANLGNRVRSDEHATMVGLMQEAGVQWAREEISWDRVEPEKGLGFQWGGNASGMYNYDQAIRLQHDAGINVLGLLAYNPAWFKSKNPVLDAWLADWGNYVYNVVARYGRERGQIRYWEVWNEPNLRASGYEHGLYTITDYVRVLDVAYAAIKSADPQAVVVLGGLCDVWSPIPTPQDYDSLDYFKMILEAGGWGSFDVLGWHPYRPGSPEAILYRRGPAIGFQQQLDMLDMMLTQYGGPKPIWLTEMGWSSYTGAYGVSETDQAVYLQRLYMTALAHPSVEKIFWYDLREDTDANQPYEYPAQSEFNDQFHYGLLRRTFPLKATDPVLRKPAFLAYRAMTSSLQGMYLETIMAEDNADFPGLYWYRFSDGQHQTDVMWRLYGPPDEIDIPCDCTEARVRRWQGSLIKVTQTGTGHLVGQIEDMGTPIFVETGPDRVGQGQFFPETGHYLRGTFAQRWASAGGLAEFGFPITGELIEPDPRTGQPRTVQYFERNRFDYFPEFQSTSFVVQLGRLGDVSLQHLGVDWKSLPRRASGDPDCLFFTETGHQICAPFRERWEQTGGLARHGLPLTDAYEQGGRQVQYFERSRFEWHPENPPAFQVQLGLLSRELYASWTTWP